MAPSQRRGSSPGARPSHLSGSWSLSTPEQSETSSLTDSHAQRAQAQSPVPSWRDRLHSGFHRRNPQQKSPQPNLDVGWERTRLRVKQAVGSVIQITGDHLLPIAAEAMSVVPVPGLAAAAKILDSIWTSIQTVQTNRSRCLRVTERCADLLVAIHQVVSESGDEVYHELKGPLERIEGSFQEFDRFLKGQAALSFFTRYLKKDDILREIQDHDQAIHDCMFLFHTETLARILQLQLDQKPKPPPQPAALLFGPAVSDPHPSGHNDHLEAIDLPVVSFREEPEDTTKDDVSSLSEKLRQVQATENDVDRARDIEDLGHVLHMALNAPNHYAVTRILQISKPDMPAAILVLLRELERQQQEHPTSPAGGSPSPRIRALTWPLDGVPARQVALLHRQFLEYELNALKRTTRDYGLSPDLGSPSLLSGTLQRIPSSNEIPVYPPSEADCFASEYSGTAITTPLHTDDELMREDMTYKLGDPSSGSSTAGLSLALERPSDPTEATTELRYRMSLSHAFHHLSVTLPLWAPSHVEVGAVGYLSTPDGAFRTLFNCRHPSFTADRPLSGIPALDEVTIQTQKLNRTQGPIAKGMKIIDKFTSTKSPSPIKRTYTVSAFGETAHMIVEKAKYQYFENLDAPKRWFRTNIQAIMDKYPDECLQQELFLVYATLNAQDHALFVNHGGSEELLDTQFHVLSSRKPGEPWGYFGSPSDETSEAAQTISKVSEAGAGWNTVLVSRLRFRLNEQEPTTH
ncbi:hypothetical protein B0H19DRAFT_1243493 [Mycena capillaripes]|nr:hypothetical protein B0H19DRAFT_1243493 [Mycena capillaripes]